MCCVHSFQSLFVFMNFNQHICKAPTCRHAYAEPHPPHKADSCRLLTLQNNLPLHSHYTTACLFISSRLNCLAAIKWWKPKNHLHLTFVIYVRVRSILAAPHFETDSVTRGAGLHMRIPLSTPRWMCSRWQTQIQLRPSWVTPDLTLSSCDQQKDGEESVLIIQQQWSSVYRGPCSTERVSATRWAAQLRSDL